MTMWHMVCRLALLAAMLPLAACDTAGQGVRYLVGPAYQIDGLRRFPEENFTADETGVATTASGSFGPDRKAAAGSRFNLSRLMGGTTTANGETFDQTALAAGHRTLQLPALVRLTNLENGRQVVVRLNDRGPADPARLVAVTQRTAQLLGAADPNAFRVRLQVLEPESRQLAAELQNQTPAATDPPAIKVAAAPRGGVQSEALAAPAGLAGAAPRKTAVLPSAAPLATLRTSTIPARLPETVTQTAPRPGVLAIECGAFSTVGPAEMMRQRLASAGARLATDYTGARDRTIVVRIAVPQGLAAAEAILRRVLPAGCLDGRLLVE